MLPAACSSENMSSSAAIPEVRGDVRGADRDERAAGRLPGDLLFTYE
jgi:hypothetical protein